MIYRVLKTVFLSGLLAGILISGVQMFKVVPLIYYAENLGVNLSNQINVPEKTDNFRLDPLEDEWMPEDGFERSFYTSISNVITGFAFSLMLVSVFLLRDRPVTFRSGILWGLAGFFVFSIAFSSGLRLFCKKFNYFARLARNISLKVTLFSKIVGVYRVEKFTKHFKLVL